VDTIDYVIGLIQDLWAYVLQVLQWLWTVLVQLGTFLWDVILKVFEYAWTFLKKIAGLFRSLWDNFFKKIWDGILKGVQKAQQWLESKLGPIISFLKRVRALYDRWFKEFIKPLLTFLQRIRRIIQLLHFLHIHIFDGLDKLLGKIEQKISTAVLTIRGVLNNMIDLLNIVADPMQIIRRPTLVYSFRRVFLTCFRVFTGLPPGYFVPSPKPTAKKGTGFLPLDFDPFNADMNPVASSYMGNEGLPGDFSGFIEGEIPDDSAVDDLTLLDYFDDNLFLDPVCTDPASCLQEAMTTFFQKVNIG